MPMSFSATERTDMVERTRLRLESSDRFPAEEYRIDDDGKVEVRTLDPGDQSIWSVWWRLTPGQLSSHVERNTVVAQWLERRLGWRRLLPACVGQEPSMWNIPREYESSGTRA
jgi:hypothetical protein